MAKTKIPVKGRSIEERQRVTVSGSCSIHTAAVIQTLADQTGEPIGYILDEVFENVDVSDPAALALTKGRIVDEITKRKPDESSKATRTNKTHAALARTA